METLPSVCGADLFTLHTPPPPLPEAAYIVNYQPLKADRFTPLILNTVFLLAAGRGNTQSCSAPAGVANERAVSDGAASIAVALENAVPAALSACLLDTKAVLEEAKHATLAKMAEVCYFLPAARI